MPSSYDAASNGHGKVSNGLANGHHDVHHVAENVGIVGMEVYFPNTYVEQSELETFDEKQENDKGERKVNFAGKYTEGFGQKRMGFCTDREDVVSLCLTVVSRLMKKSGIAYSQIGRLDVGTETLIDKSKSIKTCLMKLFEEEGNFDVEGVDNVNACYGGTAALFNCLNWVESSSWDGRYAIAVAGDIAVYRSGNARCTGGAGAVAMLIGPDAGLVFDQGVRASHMQHVYDFYKPNMSSEYPTVNGDDSLQRYMESLHKCYGKFCEKFETRVLRTKLTGKKANLQCLDHVVFHSPFTKLVQKAFSRLMLHDVIRDPSISAWESYGELEKFRNIDLSATYAGEGSKNFKENIEKPLLKASRDMFSEKTDAAQQLARNVGNMYTASLYGGIASLIASYPIERLVNKRIGLFSYGSGAASSFFSARFVQSRSLDKMVKNFASLFSDLDKRIKISPEKYHEILDHKEQHYNSAPYTPAEDVSLLGNDIFYLLSVDESYRRRYAEPQRSKR